MRPRILQPNSCLHENDVLVLQPPRIGGQQTGVLVREAIALLVHCLQVGYVLARRLQSRTKATQQAGGMQAARTCCIEICSSDLTDCFCFSGGLRVVVRLRTCCMNICSSDFLKFRSSVQTASSVRRADATCSAGTMHTWPSANDPLQQECMLSGLQAMPPEHEVT
jgi:hypothetical protein